MKKYVIFLSFLLVILISCNNIGSSLSEETSSKVPFVIVDEETAEEQVKSLDWMKIINTIPKDSYIPIEGFHTMPISATLYKNSERVDLSPEDPRLIQLLNFYTNEVNCGVYSYSQGTANSIYETKKDCNFRLELEFSTSLGGHSLENKFDKIVIVGGDFYCIMTNVPFENYSYSAFIRTPLYDVGELNWLTLFGF